MIFYYKLGDDDTVYTGKAATISNLPDTVYPYGDSDLTLEDSSYNIANITGTLSGEFPDEDLTSTVTTITQFNYASETSSISSSYEGSDPIYFTGLESRFESLASKASVFALTNPTHDDKILIRFTTKDGARDLFYVSVGFQYNYGATFPYYTIKLSSYSGTYSVKPATFDPNYFDRDGAVYYTRFIFYTLNDTLGIISLTYRNIPDLRGTPSGALTGFSFVYSYDYSKNPLFSLLQANDAIADNPVSGDTDASSDGALGGEGNYAFANENVSIEDDLPDASPAILTGLINPYYVTSSEIATLGSFLWSDSFFDNIAKTFSNPMDCIISLSSFPLASSSMSLGSSESVRVGNTTSSSTGTRLISEFVTIDCGSVSVPEVWGSYLDYAQTKLYIYIPYLGIEELPLCECMGGSVACTIRVNLLTGALVACVTLTSGTYITGSARVQPIYFSTTCKSDIPVSGATTGALAGAFQLLGGAVSSVAGIATGVAPLAISGLASAAQGVATMQSQNSQISGAVGAAGGQMAHKTPFLIFDRPVQSVPANLAKTAGYQSNSGTTLSTCTGYVICDTINLDGLALTRSELEEVEQICTSGVYIS